MLTKIYPEEVSEVLGKHSTVEPVVSLVQVVFICISVLSAWVFDKKFNAIGLLAFLDKYGATKFFGLTFTYLIFRRVNFQVTPSLCFALKSLTSSPQLIKSKGF